MDPKPISLEDALFSNLLDECKNDDIENDIFEEEDNEYNDDEWGEATENEYIPSMNKEQTMATNNIHICDSCDHENSLKEMIINDMKCLLCKTVNNPTKYATESEFKSSTVPASTTYIVDDKNKMDDGHVYLLMDDRGNNNDEKTDEQFDDSVERLTDPNPMSLEEVLYHSYRGINLSISDFRDVIEEKFNMGLVVDCIMATYNKYEDMHSLGVICIEAFVKMIERSKYKRRTRVTTRREHDIYCEVINNFRACYREIMDDKLGIYKNKAVPIKSLSEYFGHCQNDNNYIQNIDIYIDNDNNDNHNGQDSVVHLEDLLKDNPSQHHQMIMNQHQAMNYDAIIDDIDDNDDHDNIDIDNDHNNNGDLDDEKKDIIDEMYVKQEFVKFDEYGGNDIFYKIQQNWIPGNAKRKNPALNNKIILTSSGGLFSDNPIESILDVKNRKNDTITGCTFKCHDNNDDYPWVIIDLLTTNVQLTDYIYCSFGTCNEWKIEGSTDSENWTIIHQYKRGRLSNDDNKTAFHVDHDSGYFSKFRIKLTAPNQNGKKLLKIKSLQFYGYVRRVIDKKVAKITIGRHGIEYISKFRMKNPALHREVKEEKVLFDPYDNNIRRDVNMKPNEIETTSFPPIPKRQCIGDPNEIFKILNDWNGLQHNECKEYEDEIRDLNIELFDYQKRGLSWMIKMEDRKKGINGGLLCDDVGLGKTVQIIALMLVQRQKKQRINKKAKDRTIIITPLSLIDQWIFELNKIVDNNAFKIINYYGAARKKLEKKDFEECDVVISTVGTFPNIIGKLTNEWDENEKKWWTKGTEQQLIVKIEDGFFSRIIIDESHEIKNTNTKRSKIICAFATKCHSKWCLTANPINDDLPSDLSGMCKFLGISHKQFVESLKLSDKERKEAKFDKDKKLWLDLNNQFCINNKIKPVLKSIMMRRTKQNVSINGFPNKKDVIINIKFNDEEKQNYDKMVNEALVKYKQLKQKRSVKNYYMELMRMLTNLQKLCVTQINDDENKKKKSVKKYSCSSKINALIDRLKYIENNRDGDKSIVFSNFTNFLDIISNKLTNEKIKHLQFDSKLNRKKRKEILNEFRCSSKYRVLLVSMKCASIGLNLMCANHVIFLEAPFNLILDNQAIGRCLRIGQKKTVYVTRLIIKGTIEEKIWELQQNQKDKIAVILAETTCYDIIFDHLQIADDNHNDDQ